MPLLALGSAGTSLTFCLRAVLPLLDGASWAHQAAVVLCDLKDFAFYGCPVSPRDELGEVPTSEAR